MTDVIHGPNGSKLKIAFAETPPDLPQRYDWSDLRERLDELNLNGDWLKVECNSKEEAKRARSAVAQHQLKRKGLKSGWRFKTHIADSTLWVGKVAAET